MGVSRTAALCGVVLAAVLLTGCGGGSESAEPSSATPVAIPAEPDYATENQVASVLAEYEPDWREVIDASGECRFGWTIDPGGIEYMSCYIREQTITVTAQLVNRDWAALEIPPSMESIVEDTEAVLNQIGAVDLETDCGDALEPADTEACTASLGELNVLYGLLESRLDSWAPYL